MLTMCWEIVGSVLVLIENECAPTNFEWDAFLKSVSECIRRFSRVRVLVITSGGGPDSGQRERLKERLAGRTVRSAVVSDSIKVRFIASAIMLINKDHGSFTRRELQGAFDHLGLSEGERVQVNRAIQQMVPSVQMAI